MSLLRGTTTAALYCAHRMICRSLQACSFSLQGWGLIDLPLRATFSPAHPLARRDVPLTRRALSYRALLLPYSLEGGLDGLPLRVSNEGLLRPRVARAQETI